MSATKEQAAQNRRTQKRIEATKNYKAGRFDVYNFGLVIASWRLPGEQGRRRSTRQQIRLVGPVQFGLARRVAGVIPGSSRIFLGQGGRLWLVPRKCLPAGAGSVPDDVEARRVWADTLANLIEDRLNPAPEARASTKHTARYRRVVRELVDRRVADARELNIHRIPVHFARGVSEDWTYHSLMSPRHPTMSHALFVALVLGVNADVGAELIELAALSEYRSPIITREAARLIHMQSARLLATLCPAWWARGYLTEWSQVGSIQRYLRKEYLRLIGRAEDLDTDFSAAAGFINAPEEDESA